ncbi:Hpt domain-containing protein [Catenovulum maritimum]|uniref:HPt domain-containing protein n=1 Tax=Catenovulum maritimum TaxID=1513271 RepID=A0A0J8GZR6_9ALTE|nr:Hpt domain-containing protein [Catenovulum maritimum]KMT66238.1 hypothetical protein XM47_04380 [Catenovulum maritimum]
MQNNKVFDESIMHSLIGEEPELISEYQLEFYKQSITTLKEIALLFNKKDFQALKESAHFLKTSAKAIGAMRCASTLQALEDTAREANKQESYRLIMQLKTDITDFKQILSKI